jgi:hypothetical protein
MRMGIVDLSIPVIIVQVLSTVLIIGFIYVIISLVKKKRK